MNSLNLLYLNMHYKYSKELFYMFYIWNDWDTIVILCI